MNKIKGYDKFGRVIYTKEYMCLVMDKENSDTLIKQKSQNLSYKEKIEQSRKIDLEYVDVINSVGIVSWCLMNKINQSPRTTQISRLQRLVDKGLIKKSKSGLYHSVDYKPSRNDTHNLWISSIMIDLVIDGWICFRDVDIQKDLDSKYRFSRVMYDDNFIPDLISEKMDVVVCYEIELTKKSDTNSVKNKIEGYIDYLNDGKFSKVIYYTDNPNVRKSIEYWLDYFKTDVDIQIISSTQEDLLIK